MGELLDRVTNITGNTGLGQGAEVLEIQICCFPFNKGSRCMTALTLLGNSLAHCFNGQVQLAKIDRILERLEMRHSSYCFG